MLVIFRHGGNNLVFEKLAKQLVNPKIEQIANPGDAVISVAFVINGQNNQNILLVVVRSRKYAFILLVCILPKKVLIIYYGFIWIAVFILFNK